MGGGGNSSAATLRRRKGEDGKKKSGAATTAMVGTADANPWKQRLEDVKDDLQVLKSIWFHPIKRSGTHAERLDAFYAPQARQCTIVTHINAHCAAATAPRPPRLMRPRAPQPTSPRGRAGDAPPYPFHET